MEYVEKEVVTKERPITSELVRGQLRYARPTTWRCQSRAAYLGWTWCE